MIAMLLIGLNNRRRRRREYCNDRQVEKMAVEIWERDVFCCGRRCSRIAVAGCDVWLTHENWGHKFGDVTYNILVNTIADFDDIILK